MTSFIGTLVIELEPPTSPNPYVQGHLGKLDECTVFSFMFIYLINHLRVYYFTGELRACKVPHSPPLAFQLHGNNATNTFQPTNTNLFLLLHLFTMPGHSRQDTALIHGLSTSDVDRLAEACVEAKSKAYCTFPFEDACIGLAWILSVVFKSNNLINNACMTCGLCPSMPNQTHADPDDFLLSIRPVLEIPCRLRSAVVRRHDRDWSQCRERRLPRWNLRGASGDCYGCDSACKGIVLPCIFIFVARQRLMM
jgi:hypothetical protein